MQGNKSWLEISGQRLRDNYQRLVQIATQSGRDLPVLAVIKANAYGHGAGLCAPVLARAGAGWLGVTDATEGARVRKALESSPEWTSKVPDPSGSLRILVLCGLLPEDAECLIAHRLTPVVWTSDQLGWLARAPEAGRVLPIHLEIDTGMSRQGVLPGAALERLLDELSGHPGLQLDGVLTHFASAEISGSDLTDRQQQRFEAALAQVAARGLRPEWIHVGNTSTIDEEHSLDWLQRTARTSEARPMVRSGLALYGYALPLVGARSTLHPTLRPVLTWKSRIVAIEDLPAGSTIGYNGTFTASEAIRVALLPVGYADGLRRELSSTTGQRGGWAMIHGVKAPILGRISMNLTTVDITTIPRARVGDEVVLLGEDVTAEDHARLAGTIAYEILCGLRSEPRLVETAHDADLHPAEPPDTIALETRN